MWKIPPMKVATPVIEPRKSGLPRPINSPVSESPSEKAMLIPAPTAAANPTKNAMRGSPVAKAVAKRGAKVETEPSMRPTKLGLNHLEHEVLTIS